MKRACHFFNLRWLRNELAHSSNPDSAAGALLMMLAYSGAYGDVELDARRTMLHAYDYLMVKQALRDRL